MEKSFGLNKVTKSDREKIKCHKGCVLWFTGLSGSGKTTIANELEYKLRRTFVAALYILFTTSALYETAALATSLTSRKKIDLICK
ncbi:adenylyl-sulfate kinase, partial [Peptococcaceae bacterium]|nr:adenylyl-sulfate kinase [Peptococcaceae bacterium]